MDKPTSGPAGKRKTTSDDVRRAAARTAVTASKKTGDTLPRNVYELAGAPVPKHATDELQEATPQTHRWFWWRR